MSTTDQSPKPTRRWYQFSLLTLLVVMTLFIVAFGGWVRYRRYQARENRAMVAATRKTIETAVAAKATRVYYYDNGQKHWEGEFKDGVKSGLWVGWHRNGKKWQEGIYLNGKQHGRWTWWDVNGKKWMDRTYEKGKWVWFKTAKEAIEFVEDEKNILSYKGLVFGSEHFFVNLPSGKKVSNWRIDCIFNAAFRPLGKDAIPYLITALNHEKIYVRLGASHVLPQITGRDDSSYNFRRPEGERIKVLIRWQEWYAKNRNNARLDQPPNRVYGADKWDRGATSR